MKTAMRELINDVGSMSQGLSADELYDYFYKRAKSLLETEKQQIIEAHKHGMEVQDIGNANNITPDPQKSAESYYNERFNK